MSHLDDVTIALRALGEDTGPEVEAHLRGCEACRAEIAALGRVTQAARAGGGRETEQPAPAVWDRIAAELELPEAHTTDTAPAAAPRAPGAADDGPATAPGNDPAASSTPVTARGAVREVAAGRSARWRTRTAWVAAASFALGVAGTALVQNLLDEEPQAPVLAAAELAPLPGWDGAGTAQVHEVDGRRVLDVELPEAGQSGYLEVWLIDTDVERLVSLGVLSGTRGQFELPPDLDLAEFPIVDISDEPYDGDPAHSGDSVVRGTLA